jgi:hypothetical protein
MNKDTVAQCAAIKYNARIHDTIDDTWEQRDCQYVLVRT